MPAPQPVMSALVGQAAAKLTELSAEDMPLVFELVDELVRRRAEKPRQLTAAQIRDLAKHRARLLANVPREILMSRLLELGEEIRQHAVDAGTAVDGEWTGD